MPSIRELREQKAYRQEEKSGIGSLIVGAIAAFALGALLVTGWGMLPRLIKGATLLAGGAEKAGPSFAPTSKRVGRAAAANLLPVCMGHGYATSEGELELATQSYRMLQAGSSASRVGTLLGPQVGGVDAVNSHAYALMWGKVADCVYGQNARTLCDRDNRALAVEAASSFVRQAELADKHGPSGFVKAMQAVNDTKIEDVSVTRDRVVAALRARLREGHLIAKDFGSFPSGEIKRLLQDVTPMRNACAEEGIAG
jgi:hypothetical protein